MPLEVFLRILREIIMILAMMKLINLVMVWFPDEGESRISSRHCSRKFLKSQISLA